jgi:hypothetical protein
MSAAGTPAARFESVPARPAAAIEELGRVAVGAEPAARFVGPPTALRTADAAEFIFFYVSFLRPDQILRCGGFLKSRKKGFQENDSKQPVSVFRVFSFFCHLARNSALIVENSKSANFPAL